MNDLSWLDLLNCGANRIDGPSDRSEAKAWRDNHNHTDIKSSEVLLKLQTTIRCQEYVERRALC
jgi:hypothetical protein